MEREGASRGFKTGRAIAGRMRALRCLLLAIVLGGVLSSPASAASISIAGAIPEAVGSAGVAHDGPIVYTAGGVNNEGKYSRSVQWFDVRDGSNGTLAELPGIGEYGGGRQRAMAAFVGGALYVFGGLGWKQEVINGASVTLADDMDDIIRIDPVTGAVTSLPDRLPRGSYGAATVVRDGKAWILGGMTHEGSSMNVEVQDTVITFDPAAPPGLRVATSPMRLAFGAMDSPAVVIGDRVILVGGNVEDTPKTPCPPLTIGESTIPRSVCTQPVIQDIDLSTGVARGPLGSMPRNGWAHSAALIGDDIYVLAPGEAPVADGADPTEILRIPLADLSRGTILPTRNPFPAYQSSALAPVPGQAVLYTIAGTTPLYPLNTAAITAIVPASPPGKPLPPDARLGGGSATLSWSAPADDGGATLREYALLDGSTSRRQPATTWTGPIDGPRSFAVQATNAFGTSEASVSTRVDPSFPAPSAPTMLAAAPDDKRIELTWTAATGDVIGYQVFRDANVIADLPASTTRHVDSGLENAVAHQYTVRAIGQGSDGPIAAPIHAMALKMPEAPRDLKATIALTPPSNETIHVSWAPVDSATSYGVLRSEGGSAFTRVATVTGTTYQETIEPREGRISYQVVAQNERGTSAPSEATHVDAIPRPAAPVLRAKLENDTILVEWSAIQMPREAGTVTYSLSQTDPSGATKVLGSALTQTQYRVVPDQSGTYAFVARVVGPLSGFVSEKATVEIDEAALEAIEANRPAGSGPSGDDHAPTVDFRVLRPTGLMVDVIVEPKYVPEGVTYEWSWGDGAVSTGAAPSHRYPRPGNYTIRLDALLPDGTLLTAERNVSLAAAKSDGSATAEDGANDVPSMGAWALLAVVLAVAWSRRPRRPALLPVLVALSVLLSAGSSVAQTEPTPPTPQPGDEPPANAPDTIVVVSHEVWDTPRDMNMSILVASGGSLTIRGTTVFLNDTSMLVEDGGLLRIESVGDAPGILRGTLGTFIRVLGEMQVIGTPAARAVVEGWGGRGSVTLIPTGGPASILSSMSVATGTLEARHARFANYTGGLATSGGPGKDAVVVFDDVEIESNQGAGWIASSARIDAQNVRFNGRGANAYFSYSAAPIELRGFTFNDTTIGLGLRDVRANVTDLNVVQGETCLVAGGGNLTHVRVVGLDCRDYRQVGVIMLHPGGASRGAGTVSISDVSIRAPSSGVRAVDVNGEVRALLEDVAIGPLNGTGDGIRIDGSYAELKDLRFEGVGGYNVRLISPPFDVPEEGYGTGESGGRGWLAVSRALTVQVTDRTGSEVYSDATVRVMREPQRALLYDGPSDRAVVLVDQLIVDPERRATIPTYRIDAERDGWRGGREGHVAVDPVVLIRLDREPETRGTNWIPGPGPALSAIAVAVLALLTARPRAGHPDGRGRDAK